MKKTYITPEMEVIKVGAVSMLAASMGVNEDAVDTSGNGVQLGREDNTPSRPNLWDQGWSTLTATTIPPNPNDRFGIKQQ